jgi:predicted metal-dependent hydrolase
LPSLDLGAFSIAYSVVRGTSRRYTYFRFRTDLTLEVILPRGRQVDVEKALREKSTWLRHEYERVSKTRDVLSEDNVMFGGRLLNVVYKEGLADELAPNFESGVVVVTSSEKSRLRELVRRWFLKESSSCAVRMVSDLSAVVGARPRKVDVREIGKWGYCTRDGRLSFSWQLAALPDRLREYVVLHELTHLLEFNHSAAFRRRLQKVCPDFKEREKELDLIAPYNRLA